MIRLMKEYIKELFFKKYKVIILEKTTFINGIGFYKREVEFLKGKRELNLLLKEFKELDKIIVNDKHYIFYDGIKTYHVFEQ